MSNSYSGLTYYNYRPFYSPGTVTIVNCTFVKCSDTYGGCVYAGEGTVTLQSCTATGYSALHGGIAFIIGSGHVVLQVGVVELYITTLAHRNRETVHSTALARVPE